MRSWRSGSGDHTRITSGIRATDFAQRPGARRLHDVVTFHWEMLPANGDTVLVRGLEFLIIDDDGRILVDYQFFPA